MRMVLAEHLRRRVGRVRLHDRIAADVVLRVRGAFRVRPVLFSRAALRRRREPPCGRPSTSSTPPSLSFAARVWRFASSSQTRQCRPYRGPGTSSSLLPPVAKLAAVPSPAVERPRAGAEHSQRQEASGDRDVLLHFDHLARAPMYEERGQKTKAAKGDRRPAEVSGRRARGARRRARSEITRGRSRGSTPFDCI